MNNSALLKAPPVAARPSLGLAPLRLRSTEPPAVIEYGDKSLLSSRYHVLKVVGQGAFGRVSVVKTPTAAYYVKQSTVDGEYYNLAKTEIETNLHVSRIIPDYVSRLHAAKLTGSPRDRTITSEQWFEYLPGMDMVDAVNDVIANVSPKRDSYIATLYCMANTAIKALHNIGYIHRDIKPENLFVVQEAPYAPLAVKLIDFGSAYKIADNKQVTLFGTTQGYSPYFFRGETPATHPHKRPFTGKPNTSNNFYAMNALWESLFGRVPPPACTESPKIPMALQPSYYSADEPEPVIGGKRRHRKTRHVNARSHARAHTRKN